MCGALLKQGGRLGFVITQSVFKTSGGGQGFRRFQLGKGAFLKVIHVDDMVDFQPFEDASNRTAIFILEKGKRTEYPVPYTIWQKTARGRSIAFDSTLDEVSRMTRRLHYVAEPVSKTEAASSWLTARPRLVKVVRKMLGESEYTGRAGAYSGGANAIFWLEVINARADGTLLAQNLIGRAKREVEQIQGYLEKELVYPLLKGRDVKQWSAIPSAHILMTHDPAGRLKAISEKEMQSNFPKTWAYLKHFESHLRSRAAFKLYFTRKAAGKTIETGPFYSMFDVGEYTFAPHKVVWGRIGSSLAADAVQPHEGSPVIPQETHTLVALSSHQEALYFAAVVNSLPFNFAAVSYSQTGGKSFASPHILQNIRVPKFDDKNKCCCRLAELGAEAKKTIASGREAELEKVSGQINETVLELWGLTSADLREIQAGYDELTKADLETDEEEIEEEVEVAEES